MMNPEKSTNRYSVIAFTECIYLRFGFLLWAKTIFLDLHRVIKTITSLKTRSQESVQHKRVRTAPKTKILIKLES